MKAELKTYIIASLIVCQASLSGCNRFKQAEEKTATATALQDTNPCGGEDNLRALKFAHNVDTIYSWIDEDTKITQQVAGDGQLMVEENFTINSQAEYDELKSFWSNRSAAGKNRSQFPEIDFAKSTLIACKIVAPTFSYPDNIELKKDCPGFELRVGMRPPMVQGSAYTSSNYYTVVPKLPDSVKVELVSYRAQ